MTARVLLLLSGVAVALASPRGGKKKARHHEGAGGCVFVRVGRQVRIETGGVLRAACLAAAAESEDAMTLRVFGVSRERQSRADMGAEVDKF